MKKIFALLIGLVASSAHATMVTFEDFVDPDDVLLSYTGGVRSFTFAHRIGDDGFRAGKHLITDARLTVSLSDDADGEKEFALVKGDGTIFEEYFQVAFGEFVFDILPSLIQEDGKLVVTVTAKKGDFYFRDSRLVVDATPVPEPGTLALTGLGLVAIGFGLRRRKKA